MNGPGIVRAAGGVVVRGLDQEPRQVAIVHRPRHGDWSLPKGKLLSGERDEQGALREVEEETGLVCRLGLPLDPVTYRDRKGRLKMVLYWVMEPLGGEFTPGGEVDELRWVSIREASEILTYESDRQVLRGLGW